MASRLYCSEFLVADAALGHRAEETLIAVRQDQQRQHRAHRELRAVILHQSVDGDLRGVALPRNAARI